MYPTIIDNFLYNQSFLRELKIWSKLKHENILPLRGFALIDGPIPALVSEWMENGNSDEYLQKQPNANLISLVHYTTS